jgi:hypothetical protein
MFLGTLLPAQKLEIYDEPWKQNQKFPNKKSLQSIPSKTPPTDQKTVIKIEIIIYNKNNIKYKFSSRLYPLLFLF